MSVVISLELPGLLNASLEFPSDGVTAIIGPSGAGKSLLLRSIAGLERAVGTVQVGGSVWQNADVVLPTHARPMGFVFQHPSLLGHLSVRENLLFAHNRRRGREVEETAGTDGISMAAVEEWLTLGGLMDRRPDRLSGGESQRVAIARALLTNPEILLMDEPVSALDTAARQDVLGHLDRLRSRIGIPVLYVTHDIDEVARIADHLAILENGGVVADGPLVDVLTRLDLPLSHRPDAETVVSGAVAEYSLRDRLMTVQTEAGPIYTVSDPLENGSPVRVRVKARDVSLTLERSTGTSILNILPARVEAVDTRDQNKVVVRLRAGGQPFLSHLSHVSAQRLALEPGRDVFLQVKSVAVLA